MDRAMIIVGAGECGTRAAFAFRENGFAGPVTLIGQEPHLPYERPPLSKSPAAGMKVICDADQLSDAGIDYRSGMAVTGIDREARTVALSDGKAVGYEKLLIAKGATPRPLPPVFGNQVLCLRTWEDARAIYGRIDDAAKVVIIGAGFIGLELAAACRRLGAAVTVIEAASRPLARGVLPEIAAVIQARHEAEGVDIRLNAGVAGIDDEGVFLDGGEVIPAHIVVAGIGVTPNTALAVDAGLSIDNGIAVDGCLRTSDPHIFAAGDCCSFPYAGTRVRLESWRAARDQAEHAVAGMLGRRADYAVAPWFWSDQYDLGLQVAGLPDPKLPAIRRATKDDGFILFQIDQGRLISATGIGPGNAVAKDIRLAEKIIAERVPVRAHDISDSDVTLKDILRARSSRIQVA